MLSSGESNWPFNLHQRRNTGLSSPSSRRVHNLGHLPASQSSLNQLFSGRIFFILLKYFCLVSAWISSVWGTYSSSAVVVIVDVYTGRNKTRLSNGRQVNASFFFFIFIRKIFYQWLNYLGVNCDNYKFFVYSILTTFFMYWWGVINLIFFYPWVIVNTLNWKYTYI